MMFAPPLTINGMCVLVDENLADYDLIPRSWRERLFSRIYGSWRPWITHKRELKPPAYYMDKSRGVIMTTQRGLLALKAEMDAGWR